MDSRNASFHRRRPASTPRRPGFSDKDRAPAPDELLIWSWPRLRHHLTRAAPPARIPDAFWKETNQPPSGMAKREGRLLVCRQQQRTNRFPGQFTPSLSARSARRKMWFAKRGASQDACRSGRPIRARWRCTRPLGNAALRALTGFGALRPGARQIFARRAGKHARHPSSSSVGAYRCVAGDRSAQRSGCSCNHNSASQRITSVFSSDPSIRPAAALLVSRNPSRY